MEDWLLQNHLCKDAGNAPDVDGTGIASRAQQHLRGTIPQRHNLPGEREMQNVAKPHTEGVDKGEIRAAVTVYLPHGCRPSQEYQMPSRDQNQQF